MTRRFYAATLATILFSAALAACASPPTQLDLSLQHLSAQGRFNVRMEPLAQGPGIRRVHAWQVRLATPAGEPVTQARIAVDGGMPQHGHGLPTRPRVTREPEPGVYVLEGMKFSMTGWWDLRLSIEAVGGTDTAVFNVIVDPSGLRL